MSFLNQLTKSRIEYESLKNLALKNVNSDPCTYIAKGYCFCIIALYIGQPSVLISG